jgi:transcriptional regulator with XRE-family HTH domain
MNRIKMLRQSKGWTQDELGEKLSVKRSAVSKYETGKVPLTDDTIRKLSEIFGESADYILGANDSQIQNNETKLTEKDKKDIQKDLKNIMDDFKEQTDGTRYYNGIELQDEDFEYLELAMQVALEKIKVKNKEKYTPKKFKK